MTRAVFIIAIMLPKFVSGSSTQTGTALDAAAVYHKASDYAGSKPPWIQDIRSSLAPNYPIDDRVLGHEGVGLYHLKLDLRTGRVTNVTIITSSGFKGLDVRDLGATAMAMEGWEVAGDQHACALCDVCKRKAAGPGGVSIPPCSGLWRCRAKGTTLIHVCRKPSRMFSFHSHD